MAEEVATVSSSPAFGFATVVMLRSYSHVRRAAATRLRRAAASYTLTLFAAGEASGL